MRKTAGSVILGGSLAYAPQRPWIQNATIKANVLFGNRTDEKRCVMLSKETYSQQG